MNKIQVDILIVGAGNAGLCAALSAYEANQNICIIEKAPKQRRGGNSSLTMNFRFSHNSLEELTSLLEKEQIHSEPDKFEYLRKNYQPYSCEHYIQDLEITSNYQCDKNLARLLAEESYNTIYWLHQFGHRWEIKPNILPGSVPIRIKGGGPNLQQLHFESVESKNIPIYYDSPLVHVEKKSVYYECLTMNSHGNQQVFLAKSIIFSCGGFQANALLRKTLLGEQWFNIALRGVPYNTGDGHLIAEKLGAQAFGDYNHAHCTPQDSHLQNYILPGEQPQSQVNSRYLFSYGITVNRQGERFFDEGQDLPNFVYAKFGQSILNQPQKQVFQIFDHKVIEQNIICPTYFDSRNYFVSDSLQELAELMEINPTNFCTTVEKFNQSCQDSTKSITPQKLDGIATKGLEIPKSNWALPLDKPLFYAFPVKAGLTFTYGGLKTNNMMQLLNEDNQIIPNLFACGELVGGLFYENYPGGAGLMFGSVSGRVAGKVASSSIS